MAVTIRQTESVPEDYPPSPEGLSAEAEAIDPAVIWQRIEAYTALRFATRDVVWIVEGNGEWYPPLNPATVATTEVWSDDAWQTVELRPTALGGYCLPGCGPYRITGTAGDDDAEVPALIMEVYRRFAEYLAALAAKPGLRSENIPGIWSGEYDNRARARALQDSGAADVLRNYRRA